MLQSAPLPGFSDLALQSQSAFRALMDAMAHPGRIYRAPETVIAPAPLNPVSAMIALTLCDYDTPVWLDHGLKQSSEVIKFLAFHTGAPIVEEVKDAAFAFISNAKKMSDPQRFALGTDAYPDRSATLIVEVEALTNSAGVVLSGPGIETKRYFGAAPLPENFWIMARANHALYPRGVDFIFCTATELACLPRSARIEERGL